MIEQHHCKWRLVCQMRQRTTQVANVARRGEVQHQPLWFDPVNSKLNLVLSKLMGSEIASSSRIVAADHEFE